MSRDSTIRALQKRADKKAQSLVEGLAPWQLSLLEHTLEMIDNIRSHKWRATPEEPDIVDGNYIETVYKPAQEQAIRHVWENMQQRFRTEMTKQQAFLIARAIRHIKSRQKDKQE